MLGNKVIVSCSPNVFVLTDENGDDIADKKEVLFAGIKGVDHDHGVHAFVFGPDGKLYFNMGNEGKELHRADGSFVYVNRRGVEYHDRPAIRRIVHDAAPGGYTWSSLVTGIIRSTPFQMRRASES